MAFETYDGFSTLVDVTVDADGVGVGVGVSTKCFWRIVTTDIQTAMFNYATFCSATWVDVREGLSSMTFELLGYVSGGNTYSKPGSLRGLPAAATMTIQYQTGCTVTFKPRTASDRNTTQAFGESARAVSGMASGEPTIVWVVV